MSERTEHMKRELDEKGYSFNMIVHSTFEDNLTPSRFDIEVRAPGGWVHTSSYSTDSPDVDMSEVWIKQAYNHLQDKRELKDLREIVLSVSRIGDTDHGYAFMVRLKDRAFELIHQYKIKKDYGSK